MSCTHEAELLHARDEAQRLYDEVRLHAHAATGEPRQYDGWMTPERVALIARRERDLGITTRLLREHQRAGLRRR